jgi:hypothetical protein
MLVSVFRLLGPPTRGMWRAFWIYWPKLMWRSIKRFQSPLLSLKEVERWKTQSARLIMMLGVLVLAGAKARAPLLWCNGLWVLWVGSCWGVWVSFCFLVFTCFFFFFFFFLFLCPFCIPPVFLGVPLHFFYKFFYLPIQKKTKKKMANLLYEFMKILNMRPLTIFL